LKKSVTHTQDKLDTSSIVARWYGIISSQKSQLGQILDGLGMKKVAYSVAI
jgi:hypothetical protein